MGKDYRIGLIAGSILAGVAIIWVATRPSLTPGPIVPPLPDDSPASGAEASQPPEQSPTASPNRRMPETGLSSVVRNAVPGSPAQATPGKDEPAQTTRVHIVRPGETLSAISQQYYGTSNNWRKILAANEKTVKDANKIAPGTKLIIPP